MHVDITPIYNILIIDYLFTDHSTLKRNTSSFTKALFLAAEWGCTLGLQALIKYEVNITDIELQQQNNILHDAHPATIDILFKEYNTTGQITRLLEQRNRNGETPLLRQMNGNYPCAMLLIQHNADKKKKNKQRMLEIRGRSDLFV